MFRNRTLLRIKEVTIWIRLEQEAQSMRALGKLRILGTLNIEEFTCVQKRVYFLSTYFIQGCVKYYCM